MAAPLDERGRAAIRSWIDQQYQSLERQSYYQLLSVPRDATVDRIRTSYYHLVARFHPDLYGDWIDAATRAQLVSVYSRLVEAYQCLSDARKREQYDALLGRGKLRWSVEAEKQARRDPEAELTPNARRFFKLARAAQASGDHKSAVMNLRFALSVEPRSAFLRAELAQAEARLKNRGA